MGVLLYNENKGDEMIQIVSHLHQYVPAVEHTVDVFIPSRTESVSQQLVRFHRVLLGGDQLTVARTRGSQDAMANSSTAIKRLEGVIPVVEDWHARVVLAEVCVVTNLIICYVFFRLFGSTFTVTSLQENIALCIS